MVFQKFRLKKFRHHFLRKFFALFQVHISKHHPEQAAANGLDPLMKRSEERPRPRSLAPQPTQTNSDSPSGLKINPVLSRQTEFDCHQCGLACHSWANLEKHLQWHEEADVPGTEVTTVDSDSETGQNIQKVSPTSPPASPRASSRPASSDRMEMSDEEKDKMSESES